MHVYTHTCIPQALVLAYFQTCQRKGGLFCTHMYIYKCTYMYMYMCMYVCIFTYTCVHVCVHAYTCFLSTCFRILPDAPEDGGAILERISRLRSFWS